MNTRILVLFMVSLGTLLFAENPQSKEKPYDQTVSPALMEVRLSETFTGDIDGESPVRALQVLRDDQSASLVSMQRFRGKLGGRQGTFVLQGSEIIENGTQRET